MKKRPRKQSSSRVSSIAARVLSALRRSPSRMPVAIYRDNQTVAELACWRYQWLCRLTVGELKALAASVLSQDEQPGQQGKRGRKR